MSNLHSAGALVGLLSGHGYSVFMFSGPATAGGSRSISFGRHLQRLQGVALMLPTRGPAKMFEQRPVSARLLPPEFLRLVHFLDASWFPCEVDC